jgi:SAM-dependent methyltransferase
LFRVSFSGTNPLLEFNTWETIRINQRRLEHLASLGLDLEGKSVLEVGAGIGNLTHFFLDRGCRVFTTEGRPDNLTILKARYPQIEARLLDLDVPDTDFGSRWEIVFCYGLLYHLQRPAEAMEYMARHCCSLLLLETCVSFGDDEQLRPCSEDKVHVSQAVSGVGCRPTRRWVVSRLKARFPFVYMPLTQPYHEQFPVDWKEPSTHKAPFSRAVFVASRAKLANPLVEEIPDLQQRH